ncbi:SDR family NAD(P)-dependent oxidoreductase [Bifidobacterium aquikefiricola]|uniref:SDR family NAD(P)-dependent oxidoreductase n=1 Tax=Bifidobacterium aquikefiricola TaxID=3059038 RepID=A0AB39U8E9_9BIFI
MIEAQSFVNSITSAINGMIQGNRDMREQRSDRRFAGARVVITGAGSGIGRSMAEEIVAEGGRVALWGWHKTNIQEVADELNERYGSEDHPVAFPFRVDVSQAPAVNRTALKTIEALGGVNVVINNAGIISGKPFKELDDRSVRQTFGVNSMALFWTTKAFLKELEKHRRAIIVNVASIAGFVSVAGQTDYSASKYAAVGFTNALRAELKHERASVKTLLVCPYYIDTGMFSGVDAGLLRQAMHMLSTDTVAHTIVDAIAKGKERLFVPTVGGLATLLSALPVSLADRMLEIMHANDAMTHFVGRRDAQRSEASTEASPES